MHVQEYTYNHQFRIIKEIRITKIKVKKCQIVRKSTSASKLTHPVTTFILREEGKKVGFYIIRK